MSLMRLLSLLPLGSQTLILCLNLRVKLQNVAQLGVFAFSWLCPSISLKSGNESKER